MSEAPGPAPTWRLSFDDVVQERGSLMFASVAGALPFTPRRILVVRDVPAGTVRGQHGYVKQQEVLICVHGSCDVLVDDLRGRREVVHLDGPDHGVLVDRFVWTEQFNHSPDCVLLVLASEEHDPDDVRADRDELARLSRAASGDVSS